ncbi:alpha/beta hydrolase [Erythrobacter sp. GH1-10]|uniref:alpha/beta hydrolase n=1 Tax=Erythrobacter sp. GH1-10 TaxID=3349334 RepID=UPI003877E56E
MISLILAGAASSLTPAEPQPIVIGEQYTLEAVGAERAVNVILPPDYAEQPDTRWPVIYALDAGMDQDLMLVTGLERWNRLWGRSRNAIIVGIETRDRQRELLPPTGDPAEQERYSTAGSSSEFRDWLVSTVKPMIEARYRTDGTAILAGESAAGHFVVETWLGADRQFDGYAAISPALQWDNQSLSQGIAETLEGRPPLYLSLADEGGATETGILRLVDAISSKQDFCFSDRRSDLVHANALHGLMPEALQYLLPTDADWLEEYGLGLRCERGGKSVPE